MHSPQMHVSCLRHSPKGGAGRGLLLIIKAESFPPKPNELQRILSKGEILNFEFINFELA